MKFNLRFDDAQPAKDRYDAKNYPVSFDLSVETKDDLIRAQSIINGLLAILPTAQPAEPSA